MGNITARELLLKLLDVPSHHVIIVKDKDGKEVKKAQICSKEDEQVVGALFG